MFVRFDVENYRSIFAKQSFNMKAGAYKEKVDDNTFTWTSEFDQQHLLSTSAIYGANASGKSNLIRALTTMKMIVVASTKWQVDDNLPYEPFSLSKEAKDIPTEFEVEFISNNVRYQYGFSYNSDIIVSEWLFAYPKNKAQKWFLRVWNGEEHVWDLGRNLLGEKQVWVNSTKNNSLFLSTAVQLNSSQLKPVFDWFSSKVSTTGIKGWSNSFSSKKCFSSDEEKQKILSLMRDVDIYVDDINVDSEQFDEDSLPESLAPEFRAKFAKTFKGRTIYDPKFIRKDSDGEDVEFDLEIESDGTKRFFAFAGPWLDALSVGKVLFVDELNSNLHPLLVRHMVRLFHSKKTNPKNAQLVFTTHETSILNQDVFRRDQVWFMQRTQEHKSELYPLSDFTPRKGVENLEDRYLSGQYGALPYIRWEEC